MNLLYGLPPEIGEGSKVLILGSMPGEESLRKREYYGNPRNHFWKIMFSIFDQPELRDYHEKIAFLKARKIALWDVIYSCNREGSLDTKIKNEVPNDIVGLLQANKDICLIVCNGTKAFNTFKKFIGLQTGLDCKVLKMPSTSPVPGKYNKTLEGKIQDWQVIKEYL